jgi:beta-lactamase regulating signal transducer with metallopeptidase domain
MIVYTPKEKEEREFQYILTWIGAQTEFTTSMSVFGIGAALGFELATLQTSGGISVLLSIAGVVIAVISLVYFFLERRNLVRVMEDTRRDCVENIEVEESILTQKKTNQIKIFILF